MVVRAIKTAVEGFNSAYGLRLTSEDQARLVTRIANAVQDIKPPVAPRKSKRKAGIPSLPPDSFDAAYGETLPEEEIVGTFTLEGREIGVVRGD